MVFGKQYTRCKTKNSLELKVSTLKSKAIALKGQVSLKSEITADNTVLEKVNIFIYFGCNI
jgi:hypothetical protein